MCVDVVVVVGASDISLVVIVSVVGSVLVSLDMSPSMSVNMFVCMVSVVG